MRNQPTVAKVGPNFSLYYWPLSPYVEADVYVYNQSALNGLIYKALVDSLAQCLRVNFSDVPPMLHARQFSSQVVMLPKLLDEQNVIGMPVVAKARSPDLPKEFVGIVETNGLAWLYQADPPEGNILVTGFTTVWPIMLLVLVLTGYAALIIWVAESRVKKNRQFDATFSRGFFQSYWFAYISATTVGYGDKVPKSFIGKVTAVLWILCGISLMSSFTATMTNLINNLSTPPRSELPPLHNIEIGVLNSSIDRRLILERSAKPIDFNTLPELVAALKSHVIDSVAIDPMVYCTNVEAFNSQDLEFRLGVTDPTVIGFIYHGRNVSLLNCMKRVSFYMQHEFDAHVAEVFAKMPYLPRRKQNIEQSMFGESGHLIIVLSGAGLLIICVSAVLAEAAVRLLTKKVRSRELSNVRGTLDSTTANQYAVLARSEHKL